MTSASRLYLTMALLGVLAGACGPVPTEPLAPITMQSNRLAVSAQGSCLVDANGGVVCWGLGGPRRIELPVATAKFVALNGGGSHFCGLTADSTAYCWGQNLYGEIGDGARIRRDTPTRVLTDRKFVRISAGGYTTCAIDPAGKAFCWGDNELGELGNGRGREGAFETIPVEVRTSQRFRDINTHGSTCGLTRGGRVFCWGTIGLHIGDIPIAPGDCKDNYWLLFRGRACALPTPIKTNVRFAALAGRGCGLSESGEVYCPGVTGAVKQKGSVSFRSVTAGGHFCGLDDGGVAYCWGNNWRGQLGIGEHGSLGKPSFRDEPTPVLTGLRFQAIVAESSHTCALTADEQVWCWGENSSEQLGPGTGTPSGFSSVPVRVLLPPL